MRALLSLLLLLAAATVAWLPHRPAAEAMAALHVGLLMLGAWLTGYLFNTLRLPRISGYLLFGVAVGPHALGLVGSEHIPPLAFASHLAVALIALTAGGEIRLDWLRRQLRVVAGVTAMELALVWSSVAAAFFFAESFLPVIREAPLDHRAALAVLAGLVATSNSPAVAIAMISEYRAEGPLSAMTLAVTIFKDMLLVVLFATVLALGRGWADAAPGASISAGFFLAVGCQLLGSLLLGAMLGAVVSWWVHRLRGRLLFFVLGLCLLFALLGEQELSVAGHPMHLEPLLMGLSAGLVAQNLFPRTTRPLFKTIELTSLPLYCLFFSLAGVKLDLSIMAVAWPAVLGLCALRAGVVWSGVTLAARWAGLDPAWRRKLWLGFIPQAGVSLALAALIGESFDEPAGKAVVNVLVGMIAIHELVGPVGFRWGLLSSGDAGGLERAGAPSILAQTHPGPNPPGRNKGGELG